MKRYFLDYNEKIIIHAIVRNDSKHAGKQSAFRKKAHQAIEKAKDELNIGEMSDDIRRIIIDKIQQSIAYSQPWELMGETYCSRGTFYQYRKQFCFLIADNLGMIDAKRRNSARGR